MLTAGILTTKPTKVSIHYFACFAQLLWKYEAIYPHWLLMSFKIRVVLVITGCEKKKQNVSFLVWCASVVICGRLLVICGRLLVVGGRLLVVCSRLLVVCGHLLVVFGRLLVVCGRLWAFAVGLWSFAGGLWSFVLVNCFSNYDSVLILKCCLQFSDKFLYGILLRDFFCHKIIRK